MGSHALDAVTKTTNKRGEDAVRDIDAALIHFADACCLARQQIRPLRDIHGDIGQQLEDELMALEKRLADCALNELKTVKLYAKRIAEAPKGEA